MRLNQDTPPDADGPHVLVRTEGRAGLLTLNRPRALNALTHAMVLRIDEALTAWEADPTVETVVIRGAGERGLCAGGDIRAIHEDARAGGGAGGATVDFWRDEYRLNARIARYPKPYVALMDGIVMGGGVGVSAHGSVRVVTERSRVAMPETGIGFAPDVGGTYLLGRAPGELGTHLALTGAQADAADALLTGLADHFVPSDELPRLVEELTRAPAHKVLPRFARTAPPGRLAAARDWIDTAYAAPTVEEIVDRLLDSGVTEAKETAATLLTRSPTALKVTLEALRRARRLDSLEAVLAMEFRLSHTALGSADLVEGIRAQVIDKDRSPRWTPATLAEVTPGHVAAYFAERDLPKIR
ncbi:enoyl-CoA hydratase/isomerase family protein [Streptomyces sp. NPDC047981]|uniref:enoyl-CoA hydratase/isomerase family protein n=1 Tax=Streptomyces sp. NPDC047981 TaxID=3154610 RepID=UPI00341AFD03